MKLKDIRNYFWIREVCLNLFLYKGNFKNKFYSNICYCTIFGKWINFVSPYQRSSKWITPDIAGGSATYLRSLKIKKKKIRMLQHVIKFTKEKSVFPRFL